MIDGLEPYPPIKDSGVPWPGKVPEHWNAFVRREVLPYAVDGGYLPDSVKTSYEISFTRYLYKLESLRTLEEIHADILALETETEGLLGDIVGVATR